MHPMILGLKHLIDPRRIGSFTSKKSEKWYIRNNDFLLDTAVVTSVISSCPIDARNLPIVLLIGPGTGSSGEFLVTWIMTYLKSQIALINHYITSWYWNFVKTNKKSDLIYSSLHNLKVPIFIKLFDFWSNFISNSLTLIFQIVIRSLISLQSGYIWDVCGNNSIQLNSCIGHIHG